MATKDTTEIKPPWVVSKSVFPGDDPYWRTADGRAWLRAIFLPYYDGLTDAEQTAYCERWKAPQPWISLFLHPEIEGAFADADSEDFGEAEPPLNFRKIFLDEPDSQQAIFQHVSSLIAKAASATSHTPVYALTPAKPLCPR